MEYDAIEFTSYVDDTNSYTYGQSFDEKIKSWKHMYRMCECFHRNDFKSNSR